MSENKTFDLIIKNVQVIKPKENGMNHFDIGIKTVSLNALQKT